MFRFRIRQESAAGQIAEATAPADRAFLHPDTASGQALQVQPERALHREGEPREAESRSLRHRLSFRLFALTLFLLTLQTFVIEISVVPTGSMEGTILVGDHLFLDKLLYGPEIPFTHWRLPAIKSVHRGDIIVFRYPRNPEETFLKRVAAVGGDRLEIHNGVVYINSRPVDEPYAVHRRPLYDASEQMQPIMVRRGHLVVV